MITEELTNILKDAGAALVGVGRVDDVDACSWPVGVAVAVRIPSPIVRDLLEAPTAEYGRAYDTLNAKLNSIVTAGADYLIAQGYRALAQTTANVVKLDPLATAIPHKTVATRAGLGWIGKSCLLVTPEYGSAVRISSILTDAPLRVAQPIVESRCGSCQQCVDHCPAKALKGTLWHAGIERSALVDAAQCDGTMRQISAAIPGLDHDLCGKCIAVCPHTQQILE